MHSMKKFFAITLLALLVGLGTPAIYADGTAESPGVHSAPTSDKVSVTAEGTAESPGYLGTAESPGFMATVFIYLNVLV
jgi:hypothetical protein